MEKKVMRLATPGKRLLAYLIDQVAPIILGAVSIIAAFTIYSASTPSYDPFGFDYGFNEGISVNSIVGPLIAILISLLFYAAFLGVEIYFFTKGRTIGKAVMGIQVVSSVNGEPLSVGYMILREWFAKKAAGAVLFVGWIWILIDDKHRGWHDKIMDTYVVNIKEERYQSE